MADIIYKIDDSGWIFTENESLPFTVPGVTSGNLVEVLAHSALRTVSSNTGYLGLSGTFDYYIDTSTGSDLNAGTSEGAAWKTLSKMSDVTLTSGEITRILVKSGTYDTADDYVEVIENSSTNSILEIVYEPGCVMDGTAANAIAATNGHEFSGSVDWYTVIYGNGLQVNNYSEGTALSPNGFGNRDTHHLTVYDAYCDNCDDGFSCHENATMITYNCSAINAEKGAFLHVDSATVEHHQCYFDLTTPGGSNGATTDTVTMTLNDCVIVTSNGLGGVAMKVQCVANRCQIGDLTNDVLLSGAGGTFNDCFLNAYADGHYPHTYRRCYGLFSSRLRTPGGLDMQNCVIVGPATGKSWVIYSDYNSGGNIAMTFSKNIVATSSFQSFDATNAGYLLAAAAVFDGNSLWNSAAYDADLSATLISNTITTDPEIGSADSLLMSDYASAVYLDTLAGFGSSSAVFRNTYIPRVLTYQLPVLSNFIDGLDGNPPTIIFDSNYAGTLTWDFHSTINPPDIGEGDIGTGTAEVVSGENTLVLNLSAYALETGYLHLRLTTSYGISNILTSSEFTVPDGPVWEFLPMETAALTAEMTFTRASTADYTDENGDNQTAAVNEPRFDHTVGGVPLGLMMQTGEYCWADLDGIVDFSGGGTVYVEFESASIAADAVYVLMSNVNSRLAYSNLTTPNVNGYDGATSITFGASFANSTTHKLVLTGIPSGTCSAYANGSLSQSKTTGIFTNFDGNLYIGCQLSGSASNILNGHIRSIRIWNKVLTNQECLDLTA